MSVDFTDVEVGDRIKLTRKNGDEITFTVADVRTHTAEDSYKSVYYPNEWDTLEFLVPPLPTGEHAVVGHPTDTQIKSFVLSRGEWYLTGDPKPLKPEVVCRALVLGEFKVLYEGVKQEAENE